MRRFVTARRALIEGITLINDVVYLVTRELHAHPPFLSIYNRARCPRIREVVERVQHRDAEHDDFKFPLRQLEFHAFAFFLRSTRRAPPDVS